MSNNKDDKKPPTNQQSPAPESNVKDSKAKKSQSGGNIKKNDSDTTSTGTCGSLLNSGSQSMSSSLLTYETLDIKNESEVYVDMTKDVAQSIIDAINDDIEALEPSKLLTNPRGNILSNLLIWAAIHIQGTTDMDPLENRENLLQLVNSIKTSTGRRLKHTPSQVRFSEMNLQISDTDSIPQNIPALTEGEPKLIVLKEEKTELKNDSMPEVKSSVWDKLNNVANVFKGMFVGNKAVDKKNLDSNIDVEKSDLKDTFKNPVAGTSKGPVPLAELGKCRPYNQMITLSPRANINQEPSSSESQLNKNDQMPRPKPPRSLNEKTPSKSSLKIRDTSSKLNINDLKPKADLKSHLSFDSKNGQKNQQSNSKDDQKNRQSAGSKVDQKIEHSSQSQHNLAKSTNKIEPGLKHNRNCVGLTQLIQHNNFKNPSNLNELINLLAGRNATKDWARSGKVLFHFPEDLRTFGTLLALVVGGCVLNGIITTAQRNKALALKQRNFIMKMDQIAENELLSGYLRAIELKNGMDTFAQGFQDGIRAFSPRIRRY